MQMAIKSKRTYSGKRNGSRFRKKRDDFAKMADLTFSIKRVRAARVYSDPDPDAGGFDRNTRRCVAKMNVLILFCGVTLVE